METPLLFAPPGFEETPTLKRSDAFPIVVGLERGARIIESSPHNPSGTAMRR